MSNPNLLRIWYEPITALIVTEQRGRSPPSSFCSSNGDGERTPKFWRITERRDDNEDDGHVIIGSAEEEEAFGSSQDREQVCVNVIKLDCVCVNLHWLPENSHVNASFLNS